MSAPDRPTLPPIPDFPKYPRFDRVARAPDAPCFGNHSNSSNHYTDATINIPPTTPKLEIPTREEMAANAKEERKVRIYKILTAISILALIAFTIVTSVYYSSKERTMEVPKNETKSIPHTSAPGAEILRVARSTETESMEENIPTLEPFAPPYPDSCKVNNDCDWGYRCIAKACYPGCDSQADCRKPHLCQHWIHDGPSFKYCLVKPHQTCREHLAFCSKNNECCSGKCKAKGKWKMCQPSGGRGRGRPSDIGGNDEGLDAKQEVHSV